MPLFNPAHPNAQSDGTIEWPQTKRPVKKTTLVHMADQLGVVSCGDTFDLSFQLREPAPDGTDSHYWNFGPLVADPPTSPATFEAIAEAILLTEQMIGEFGPNLVGSVSKDAHAALKKADDILEMAGRVNDWWMRYEPPPGPKSAKRSGGRPSSTTWRDLMDAEAVMGWPLWEPQYPHAAGCQPGALVEGNVNGRDIDFYCPSKADQDTHRKDAGWVRSRLDHAARWARCGQELVFGTAIYNLNRGVTAGGGFGEAMGEAPADTGFGSALSGSGAFDPTPTPIPPGTFTPAHQSPPPPPSGEVEVGLIGPGVPPPQPAPPQVELVGPGVPPGGFPTPPPDAGILPGEPPPGTPAGLPSSEPERKEGFNPLWLLGGGAVLWLLLRGKKRGA